MSGPSEIETELLVKQKYEASLVELEKDLAMCINVSTYSYADTSDLIAKLNNWESFLSSAQDLPQPYRSRLLERISNGKEQLNEQLMTIQKTVSELFASAKKAKDLKELLSIEEKLGTVGNLELPASTLADIAKIREGIRRVQVAVQALPDRIDSLSRYRTTGQMEFDSIVKAECIAKLDNLKEKQLIWTQKYFTPVVKDVSNMTATNCSSWLNQTQTLPEFLSDQPIKQYNTYKQLVERRLRSCRVQGVVSMYNDLSEEEKEEFLNVIQETS